MPLRVAFSTDEPHGELIEEVKGTIWECNPYSNLHHIGFWGDGLAPEADRLAGLGCPIELTSVGPEDDVPALMTYHRHAVGVRIEIVDAAARDAMSMLWKET